MKSSVSQTPKLSLADGAYGLNALLANGGVESYTAAPVSDAVAVTN